MRIRDVAIGILLLLAGYWVGAHSTTSTAKPVSQQGIVDQVSRDSSLFSFTANGGGQVSYPLPSAWRDSNGLWHYNSRPACMAPLSHGQQITVGLVSSASLNGAPASTTVAWIECP